MSIQLLRAVGSDNIEEVEKLLDSGSVDINYVASDEERKKYNINKQPLAIAVSKTKYAMTHLLLQHGADIDIGCDIGSRISMFGDYLWQSKNALNQKFAVLLLSYGVSITKGEYPELHSEVDKYRESKNPTILNFFLVASLLNNDPSSIEYILKYTHLRLTSANVENYLGLSPRKKLTKFQIGLITDNFEHCVRMQYIEASEVPGIQKALSEYFKKVALEDSKSEKNATNSHTLFATTEKNQGKSKNDIIMELSTLVREQGKKLEEMDAKLNALLGHAKTSLTPDSPAKELKK